MNIGPPKTPDPAARSYRVSDLHIDVGQQRVTRADAEISLPKLSFDLLLVLIRGAPDIISIDELISRVWPGLVVSPETVSQRIKLLRDALGDDPRNPRYIAGLRGRGYRLIGAVTDAAPPVGAREPETQSKSATVTIDPTPTARPARWRTGAFLALAGVGLLVLLVAGFLVRRAPPAAPARAQSDSVVVQGVSIRSVAVLPFENMSGNASDDYIGLGLAEMVLNRLSGVPELLVIARSSSFAFRGMNADAREVGRKLNVRYLVEGSVQRVGQKLRVSAHLVDTASGRQFNPRKFDRDLTDIFKVQDEIAEQVVADLEVSIGGLDTHRPEQARNVKFEAYLAYLQGRALLESWRVADAAPAIEHFSRAIAIDPGFAAAYTQLARAQFQATFLEGVHDPLELPEAKALVDKALALDNNLGEAYIMRAQLNVDHDPAGAEADFRKGLELSPSYGVGYVSFAEALYGWKRPQEALEMIDRAIVVDPLVPRPYYLKAMFVALREDANSLHEAEGLMLRVLEIDPNFSPALTRLASWQWEGYGQTAEAIKLTERALRLDPERLWIRQQLSHMYLDVGDVGAAENVISGHAGLVPSGLIGPALLRGDWRKAGQLAYARPKAQLHDDSEMLAVWAIRDYALKTGELDRAIKYLYQVYELRPGQPVLKVGENGFVIVSLALLLQKKGDQAAAQTMMKALSHACLASNNPVACANLHALADERAAALDSLRKMTPPNEHVTNWWYLIDQSPLWDAMRSNPGFQAIASEMRDDAARQRALLEQMRSKGEVPTRSSASPAAPSR